MSAVISVTEDQAFDAIWQTVTQFLDAADAQYVFKGFQNMTATPAGVSYVVISPGIRVAQDQMRRAYDITNGLQIVQKHRTYYYQVDCFGPKGPDWADMLSAAWHSPWVADYAQANNLPFAPLYADDAQQLNIVNSESMYEQRFMTKLYVQINQAVSLPQDFFSGPGAITIKPPADDLPV